MDNYAEWHERLNACVRELYGTHEQAEAPLTGSGGGGALRVCVAGAHPKTYEAWAGALAEGDSEVRFAQPDASGRYDLEAEAHFVVQVIRATQPVSRSDGIGYDSLKEWVPNERHRFAADEMDRIDPEEQAEVSRYIEEKINVVKPSLDPVYYISSKTGEGLEAVAETVRVLASRRAEVQADTERFRLRRRIRQLRQALQAEIDELRHAGRHKAERKEQARSAIRRALQDAEKIVAFIGEQQGDWERLAATVRAAAQERFRLEDGEMEGAARLARPASGGDSPAAKLRSVVAAWADAAVRRERAALREYANRENRPERLAALEELRQAIDSIEKEAEEAHAKGS
ncbi:hypothetical protein [Paenibacillus sp.]|uniref:hypothetical protein n=1 Tax=Paenibacillus sp. TaxID=58172 RepID=UPI002D6AB2C2|nr:hypothetical protein [Paenibacillus sp.]HZG85595.1 hypothetical protein [Paenibacillus sp.]